MNKVIKGKRYDTEKAQEIGYCTGGAEYTNDLYFWRETLYQKRTGEFFLYCEGNAGSQYASHCGNSSGYGEQIKPISFDNAKEWGEKNLTADEYEKVFGAVEVGKTITSISLSNETMNKMKQIAVSRKMSVSELIEELISNL